MTEDEFWNLIGESREGLSNPRLQHEKLPGLLRKLPPEEIISFADHFYRKDDDAYRWDLRAVGTILSGGMDEDDFMDFRSWLIAQGKEFFEAVLARPEAMEERAGDDMFYEGFRRVPQTVYREKTGEDMPIPDYPPASTDLAGTPWRLEDLPNLYPD